MADGTLFDVHLVTPERILVSGPASEVILRTGDGDITFLPGHTPLVGTVEPGVLRVVRSDGGVERVATHGGFVQVEKGVPAGDDGSGAAGPTPGTRVTLLIGVAELAEEIDVDRARVALGAAEARLAELAGAGRGAGGGAVEGGITDPELVDAETELLRAQVRLETVDVAAAPPS